MSESGSTPTKRVTAPRRERKPNQALQIIVECAPVVLIYSSAILGVDK